MAPRTRKSAASGDVHVPPPAKKPRGRPPRAKSSANSTSQPAPNNEIINEAPPVAESTILPARREENLDVDARHRVSTGSQTGADDASSVSNFERNDEVEYESRQGIYDHVQENDSFMRLANVLENTLKSVRDSSMFNTSNTHLLNRLASKHKPLPIFRGEPLEWQHFKQAYETSTLSDAYTDKENISRLFAALQGEAREAVSPLLAIGSDSNSIIRALELKYGNKQVLARKLVKDIQDLPSIVDGKINLIDFASKLKNSVTALKALGLAGHLQNVDLQQSVGNKIPTALKYVYNRYVNENASGEKTVLEKVSEFLIQEAELSLAGGLFDIDTPEPKTKVSNNKKQKVGNKERVFTATHATVSGDKPYVRKSFKACIICNRENHAVKNCNVLARETVERRWFLVKKHNLCFKCLNRGHSQTACKNKNCAKCDKPHNIILHNDAREKIENQTVANTVSADAAAQCSTHATASQKK